MYVDNGISNSLDEPSLLRLDPDEKWKLDEQDSIIDNSTLTSPKTVIEIPTKAHIDSLHDENERNRRDLEISFYDKSSELVENNQDKDFNDNKITKLDSMAVNRIPASDDEVQTKSMLMTQ